MNIPNEVKLWHKSAPLLITAATILGLIVIFHHYAPLGAAQLKAVVTISSTFADNRASVCDAE